MNKKQKAKFVKELLSGIDLSKVGQVNVITGDNAKVVYNEK